MDATPISDAERERTAERLRTAVGEGRLTLAEFEDRLRTAYATASRGELVEVTGDLPAPIPPTTVAAAASPAPRRPGEWAGPWRSWLGGALIMLVIWAGTSLADGEVEGFWPAFPIGIWAAVLAASMLTVPGQGADA
jgi:hypothetical protein